MQQNSVDKILRRINTKLNKYCPKSSPNINHYFASEEAVSVYRNTHSIAQTMTNQECIPHVIVPKFAENSMRTELEQHKKVIDELKSENSKLLNEVSFLQKRVHNLERRASSQSVKKINKKEISRRQSKKDIQESFYSNCLPPKLKKKTIKVKKGK